MTTLNQWTSGERQSSQDCLGSTCMKWMPSGELSTVDQARIMERLAEVDANLSACRQPSATLLRQQ